MQVTRSKLSVPDGVVSAALEDESVLLNIETGMYYGLDAVGTRIWELIESGASHAELLSQLLEEYEVDLPRLHDDVAQFIDLLVSKGLLYIRDD